MQYTLIATLAVFLIVSPFVHAEPEPVQFPNVTELKLKQIGQKIEKLRQQITELEDRALQNHPELVQREKDIDRLIEEAARRQDYDMDAVTAKLDALHQRIRSGDLTADEKREMVGRIRDAQDAMMESERKLMQDEDVQKARSEYSAAMLSAMTEIEPDIQSLTTELKGLTRDFREQVKQAMNRHAHGG